jgi:predicted ATP-grasp superfamily ATP-dependent carboligase
MSGFLFVGKYGGASTSLIYSKMTTGAMYVRRIMRDGTPRYRGFRNNDVDRRFDSLRQPPSAENQRVVRWGFQETLRTNSSSIIYNSSRALAAASNKRNARLAFQEAGVPAPVFVTTDNFRDEYLPVIARPHYHARAQNFVVLNTRDEFSRHYDPARWYYSSFVNKEQEVRVHVGSGMVLAIMEKPRPTDNATIAWNRVLNDEEGFQYVRWNMISRHRYRKAAQAAISACAAVGLDFAGVDVMIYNRQPYVLEINTSPSVESSDYVAGRYARYFDMLLSSPSRVEPFSDHMEVERGSDLVFRFDGEQEEE